VVVLRNLPRPYSQEATMAQDPHEVVLLTKAATEMEAGMIIAALEDEGIKASMAGADVSHMRVAVPEEVEIFVAEGDLARAQKVLEEAEHDGEDVDWSQVDVGEPEDE
jgi:hypothetical protein